MKVLSTTVSSILVLVIYRCGEAAKPQEDPQNKIAVDEIRNEPHVKDAFITDANVLCVAVEGDGTSRSGYAAYLCEILNENRATTKWVKVVKANSIGESLADNAYGIHLY